MASASTAIVNRTGGVMIEGQTYFGLDAEVALKQAVKIMGNYCVIRCVPHSNSLDLF